MNKVTLRIFAALFSALIALSAAAGCSSSYKSNDTSENVSKSNYGTASGGVSDITVETGAAPKENLQYAVSGTDGGSVVDDTRKIIKTVSLNLETKEFDTAIKELAALTESAGGYVESSYVTGKSYNDSGTVSRCATYTLRVPADGLDAYVTALSGSFNVLSRQESSTDITDSYFDAKARLDSLVTQEERLLAMLQDAKELQYMLQLEDKLSQVRYEIESYNSTLQRYDKSVAMATISVSLQEVVEYQVITEKPKTFGERLANSFSESWSDFANGFQNFAVGLVYAFPTMLVLAAIIFAVTLVIIRSVKRGNKRREGGTHNGGSESGK